MHNYNSYITSPLLERSYYTTSGQRFSSPLKELNQKTVFKENEAVNKNDSYRQHTNYDDSVDRYYSSYDLGMLLHNDESYLEGKRNSNDDVDYYSFDYGQKSFYDKMGISTSVTIRLEGITNDSDLDLVVYDTKGNYIGTAKDCGNGCKELTLPNYNNSPNAFIIKVAGAEGQETSGESYRIKIKEDKITESDKQELEDIHKKEYQALPEDEKYHGEESIEQLLMKWTLGETLSSSEKNYLKIFSNLSDYERAEASNYIIHSLYPQIEEELQKAGNDLDDKEWGIEIDIYGNVAITGEIGHEEKIAISNIITTKFADKLWDKYMQASDMSTSDYRYINAYKEVNEFITKSTDGAYHFDDITIDENGKIEGLPQEMSRLLNSQDSNARYEELRDDIYMLMDLIKDSGLQGILGMSATYTFQAGKVV